MKASMALADKKLVGQLTRLMMSAVDFRYASSTATFLCEEVDWSETYGTEEIRQFKCYETTVVVAYARSFT